MPTLPHPPLPTRTEHISDYCCNDCGVPHLKDHQIHDLLKATYYYGTCGVCQKKTPITHIRNFNMLWATKELIEENKQKLQQELINQETNPI